MERKYGELVEYIRTVGKSGVCVAYSGGADSALVLCAAKRSGVDVAAVTVRTPLHNGGDIADAERIARGMGVETVVLEHDALDLPEVAANGRERCYYCKRAMFALVMEYAAGRGITAILDGTNADDVSGAVHRPGIKALREAGVISPLAEVGLKKADVRAVSRDLGLETADKPSRCCLATRFPYGETLTPEKLRRVENCENFLRQAGYDNFRVRSHCDADGRHTARIEALLEDYETLLNNKNLPAYFREQGFTYITLDMEGFRSGSMG